MVRKMISSMVSFSIISHLEGTLSRYNFLIMGVSHGFLSSGSRLLRAKLKRKRDRKTGSVWCKVSFLR